MRYNNAMIKTRKELIERLNELSAGQEFIEFSKKTIKTQKQIIGVRTNDVRKLLKELDENFAFLKNEEIYEIILLEGFAISKIKSREEAIKRLVGFFEKIDNWAVVDLVASKLAFNKKTQKDFDFFAGLLYHEEEFVVRFGIVGLMDFCESDVDAVLNALDRVKCEKYYVSMAIAWLLSEILIKNPQNAIKNMQKIMKNHHFNDFVLAKCVSKVNDSYRVNKEIKEELKSLWKKTKSISLK